MMLGLGQWREELGRGMWLLRLLLLQLLMLLGQQLGQVTISLQRGLVERKQEQE